MNRLVCLGLLTAAIAASAAAMDRSLIKQFKELDPQTRLEQRCDTEAMWEINAGKTSFKPDKVIAYTFADPVVENDKMQAPGAVFRSKGEWYNTNAAPGLTISRFCRSNIRSATLFPMMNGRRTISIREPKGLRLAVVLQDDEQYHEGAERQRNHDVQERLHDMVSHVEHPFPSAGSTRRP